jgi:hypothetical protein
LRESTWPDREITDRKLQDPSARLYELSPNLDGDQ